MNYNLFKVASLVATLAMTACTPFTKVQEEGAVESKIQGNWTVIHDGTAKIELAPPVTVAFETAKNQISGFDGCNNYRGSYVFEDGLIKARLSSTRMACKNSAASAVSATLHALFTQGAEAVELEMMGAKVLTLRNKSMGAELRLGFSEQLQKQ